MVFDVQRFSLHDGPGIRTTIFLKGCPLSCSWCHNPESQSADIEIAFTAQKCRNCGKCVTECPEWAIDITNPYRIDRARCTLCGFCVAMCPAGALEIIGREVTVAELVQEVEKDCLFYQESGGGVTISGGEPLTQFDFVLALAKALKERGISVVIDTAGYSGIRNDDLEKLRMLVKIVDLILYDVKFIDSAKHKFYTGVENREILSNLVVLFREFSSKVLVRYPRIPGINDTQSDIQLLIRFLEGLPGVRIELLPYHRLGAGKYARIGKTYQLENLMPVSVEEMEDLKKKIAKALPLVTVM
ncbi:MAG: glycyl-radical enzyme activating protein [Atribacterota bacterium]